VANTCDTEVGAYSWVAQLSSSGEINIAPIVAPWQLRSSELGRGSMVHILCAPADHDPGNL